ncbi:MAG: ABC transporter permease, partial [Candidatus Limnocylindrales bacterium]
DQATRRAIAELPARERAIVVNRTTDGESASGHAADVAADSLASLAAFTEPVIDAISLQPGFSQTTTFGLDDISSLVRVTEGRLPEPCNGGATCEAIRITPFAIPDGPGTLGFKDDLGAMRVTIVGVGELEPGLPLDPLTANGIVVLMDGVAPLDASPRLADVARTRFWVAPLAPDRTHAWTLDTLADQINGLERALAADDAAFVVTTPDLAVGTVQAQIATASGRLVFIASLIVAVLLAFAVFAAAMDREDVGLEHRRLRIHGAAPRHLLLFVVLEAALPALIGAVVGALVAAAVVAGLGASQGATPAEILRISLLRPGALAVLAAIGGCAAVAVGLGIHPESGQWVRPRAIALAVLPVAAVLAWDRLKRGPIDAAEFATNATGPGTVLLPGLLGLSVILGSLVIAPPIFRWLARAARRAPLSLRLSAVSVARDPLRPAATMTLLAFSLGSAVFALSYGATIRQGAADTAAFATGMDLRVEALGPQPQFAEALYPLLGGNEIQPAAELPPGTELHPIRIQAARSASGSQISILGIEPAAIPKLREWRSDYAALAPEALETAIAMPGDWELPGHALATGQLEVILNVEVHGDPIRLAAVIERADGGFLTVALGDLKDGRQTLRAPLFEGLDPVGPNPGLPADFPTGWRIVALLASNGGPAGAIGASSGARQEADITVNDLDGVVQPGQVVHLDVSGSHAAQIVRQPAPTDGRILPAIVSPDLAADVDAAGVLLIQLGGSATLPVRPIAIAAHFPMLTEPGRSFVIIDEAPFLTLLNADLPGTGGPTGVLIRVDGPTAAARDTTARAIAATLRAGPRPAFRIAVRADLEAAQAKDPFAIGVGWSLAIGAAAGVLLSVAGMLLAVAGRLQDERGELAELEETGVPPRMLARLVVLQASIVSTIGLVVGGSIGLALGWVGAASIAVGGSGAAAVPPLRLIAPFGTIAILLIGVAIGIAVLSWIVARVGLTGRLLHEAPR